MKKARLSADLPERLARLYNYETGKFTTPLDSLGIADIDAVFELAIRTYPDELPDFEDSERNRHHLYWTEEKWKQLAETQKTAEDRRTISEFRNGTPQIAYVPVPIHQWIEISQIPPPAPSLPVMRRRNADWQSAALLLKSAHDLDKARANYVQRRGKTRTMLGYIDGITPKSQRKEQEFIEVIDDEYWLSELNSRLEGWRILAAEQSNSPSQRRLLPGVRLSDVRNLRSRIKNDATIPRLPSELLAA